jgi:hypothetical protein
LFLRRAAVKYLRADLFYRVTQAYAQQRLARVLEYVNDLALRVLQINAFSIGQQVILRTVAHRFSQPPSELLLQELHDAADPLQWKPFTPESANHRDLRKVVKGIHPAPAFTLRLHNATFVPPLKLPGRNSRELYHLRRCKPLVHLV